MQKVGLMVGGDGADVCYLVSIFSGSFEQKR